MSTHNPAAAFQQMAVAMPAEINQLVQQLQAQDFWVWPRGAIEAHLGIGKTDLDRVNFVNTANQTNSLNHATHPQDLQSLAQWM